MYYMFMDMMQIPIPPESMRTRIKNKNITLSLLNSGEINVLKAPGLTDIEFKMRLPNGDYPFNQSIVGSSLRAATYLDYLETFKISLKPFQFIVVRMTGAGSMLGLTNIKVTLEYYDLEEAAEEGYDFIADIHLKQYKDYGTKKINVTTNADGTQEGTVTNTRETDSYTIPTSVTVKKGDTLQTIIKKAYGSVSIISTELNSISYVKTLNKIAVPAILAVGQIIKLKDEIDNG